MRAGREGREECHEADARQCHEGGGRIGQLTYLGHCTAYTYISVLLLFAGAGQTWIAPILLVFGILALIGVSNAAFPRRP